MAGEQSCPLIIVVADIEADNDPDLLAAIEIFDRLRLRASGTVDQCYDGKRQQPRFRVIAHAALPEWHS
jgi:hypothetical protein